MKSYGRRDFLRALGIGAAAVAIAPEVLAKKVYPAGGRIEFEIADHLTPGPVEFPWEFYGDNDFPPCRFGVPADPVEHLLIETEEPPEGYSFAARGFRILVNENCMLVDLQKFLDGWTVRVKSGPVVMCNFPASWAMGTGIAGPSQSLPFWPEIPIPPNCPLQISTFGKPFPLTGQLLVAAYICGVGYKSANVNSISLKLTPEAKHVG